MAGRETADPSPPLRSELVTFLIFRVFGTPNQNVFQNSHKAVILSEALRIYPLTGGLWRGVEGPRGCLLTDALHNFPATKRRKKSEKLQPLPMYKTLNQIESTADLGRVLVIDFMTSPAARSSARDDKGEACVSIESSGRIGKPIPGHLHDLRVYETEFGRLTKRAAFTANDPSSGKTSNAIRNRPTRAS